MRKAILSLAIAAAMLIAMPGSGFAQAKIKIAIWEFENHADGYWYSAKLGPAARDQIDTESERHHRAVADARERLAKST